MYRLRQMKQYSRGKNGKYPSHPATIDLNKKWLPKVKTIQNFKSDALGFRKTRIYIPSA